MLKWLHWGIVPFFVWFLFADPDALRRMGPGWFRLHSVNGLIFVTLALVWTGTHLQKGLASRPGPKLPPTARRLHPVLHKTLIWGLFLVALGGFGLGLTSAVLLRAGGVVPIAPPLDLPRAVVIDDGAIGALHSGKSLLFPGISSFKGDFEKKEVIEIVSAKGQAIAYGRTNYSSRDLQKAIVAKRKTLDREVIHRDYMVILAH